MGMLIRKHFSNNVEVEEVVLPSPEENSAEPKYTRTDIAKMSSNQLKKLALSIGVEVGGVSVVQLKKAIIEKLAL